MFQALIIILMDYNQVIEYLYGLKESRIKLGLENISYLLNELGNPGRKLKCIHVAGTNGKGSVCAIISSILENDNYRVGLYTSPHLNSLEERIQINGELISEEDLVRYFEKIKPIADNMKEESVGEPTFFEVLTALSFLYFAEEEVDYAVLEVGLGGRLDATNVITPLVSVLTSIAVEHVEFLGSSLEEIAFEKASIIKENSIAVSAPQEREALDVIELRCMKQKSKLLLVGRDSSFIGLSSGIDGSEFDYRGIYSPYGSLFIPLLGEHQLVNAATAITAVESLREYGIHISRDAVNEGLSSVSWPARLEILKKKPFIVLDGAHNPSGMHQLKKTITELFKYKRLLLVMAVSAKKDLKGMVSEIAAVTDIPIVTGLSEMKCISPDKIAREFKAYGKDAVVKTDIPSAVEYALSLAGVDDLILVSGSLYGAAEARRLFIK